MTALSREKAGIKGKMGKEDTQREFAGARVVFGDVTNEASITAAAFDQPADVVVCCLASRTGGGGGAGREACWGPAHVEACRRFARGRARRVG